MRLFYENDFSSFEKNKWASIESRIKASIRTINIDLAPKNLVLEQKVAIPILGEEKEIKSHLYLEDADGRVYEPNMNSDYGNNRVTAVATFHIPYTGDKDFFNIKPSKHVEVGYSVNLIDKFLIVKIPTEYVSLELTDSWKNFIKKEIIAVKSKIEENLNSLHDNWNNFHDGLEAKIKVNIQAKKDELTEEEKRHKDINPFN